VFTGLIEAVVPVKSVSAIGSNMRLSLPLADLAPDVRLGDSICVNGLCLTVSDLKGRDASFDVMAETVRVSTVGQLKPADLVNIERALPANGRLGGHIVQGHVDGIGTVDRIERRASEHIVWIAAEAPVMDLMIAKGSVAIDGVSLTVVDVQKTRFSVALIPTTLNKTNIAQRRRADKVNLEADLISKWIKKRLDDILPAGAAGARLTMEKLRQQGFT